MKFPKATVAILLAVCVVALLVIPGSADVQAAEESYLLGPDDVIPEFDEPPPGFAGAHNPVARFNRGLRQHLLRIADILGGREVVEDLLETYAPRDLVAAAAILKAGDLDSESARAVLEARDGDEPWVEVAEEFEVSEKEFHQALRQLLPRGLRPGPKPPRPNAHHRAVLVRTVKLFEGDREAVRTLHDDGWQLRDIAAVGVLHQLSGASPDDIVALKTDDNTWDVVAAELGVDVDAFRIFAGIVLGR